MKQKYNKRNTIHNMVYTKFYEIWSSMKERCKNKKNASYKNYGGRGITYDSEWENFLGFKKDMYFKYLYATKQLGIKQPSIERINVNNNYCFDNCCFIPLNQQQKNKNNLTWFKAISSEGKIYKTNNKKEFCEKFGVNRGNMIQCLSGKRKQANGWKFYPLLEKGGVLFDI